MITIHRTTDNTYHPVPPVQPYNLPPTELDAVPWTIVESKVLYCDECGKGDLTVAFVRLASYTDSTPVWRMCEDCASYEGIEELDCNCVILERA